MDLLPYQTKPIDPARPVATRGRQKARIICTNARCASGSYIVALVEDDNGLERPLPFFPCGRSMLFCEPSGDLVNVEPRTSANRLLDLAERLSGDFSDRGRVARVIATMEAGELA